MVQLVGILNVTPDSFSDGGRFLDVTAAIKRADELFAAGASIVDVGAESTRPNAQALTDDEEWARLNPVLQAVIPKYPGQISLDSYHPATVKKAWAIGPVIVNDVTAFGDPNMLQVVGELHPTVIVSHLPAGLTIQQAHQLTPVTTIQQVKDELLDKAKRLESLGLTKDQIILDPGIGFGKTPELNEQLLTFADQMPEYTVMIGYSRKRFLGDQRMELAPNLAAGNIATNHGAAYLRVHDVAGHNILIKSQTIF